MKSGIKTSEFYVVIGATILSFCAVYFGADAGAIGAANATAVAYIGNRAYVKRGDGKG
jgi:hypothetical protein